MGMSDKIEAFINELLKDDTDEWLELKRNELASIFGCVPSQINYVFQQGLIPTTVTSSNQDEAAEVI